MLLGSPGLEGTMVELGIATNCPACDSHLSQEGRSVGLCPSCLLELALDDTALGADLLLEPGEAPTLQFSPDQTFFEREIQGDRYRIRSLLGRGGMGEVWRAYDLKLRQDVALKALRTELIRNPEALATLRQEVRVAREVISPNVCRVYDLEEIDGQELISMEYVDGTTLQEILRERGPLELNEAREIASQFLVGLEAIHDAGLVHRDIKPENLMLTRTGRVVVMDFGIAKGLGEERGGLIAGTPAYMSPEQSKGGELDARADLFSAGVVLAEMVEPGGMRSFEDRRKVWEGIHQESPQLSETPWSKVIASAAAVDREARFASASALARALEEVTLRAAGDETARPYPGLSAFQQEDAEYFYGRELEVEALWKKLRQPHLLAVIGPSGAGKSSFLRAGLLPTLPKGWRGIVSTPGSRPFENLARTLVPELGEAPGTADLLLRFEEPGIALELLMEWRQPHEHAIVIVDQFEELFTLTPAEDQQRFAEMLGALPLKADVHVLLSMRDDFLIHCRSFEPLVPVFSEMTPLVSPTGASLRRAIVQPALKCGYRFEDEAIVEEMLAEVEGERGALPLVAFAAARLWEERDRETGLLTRKACERIGGVGGALAQHAEATLEDIGGEGIPIVHELFRNLVTAQGTRAARDREELLSVFDGDGSSGSSVGEGLAPCQAGVNPAPTMDRRPANHRAAETVLDTLVDARLLTSYEVPAEDDDSPAHHRIEIVHESLLANWPRLVRWQMQDAEGAKLRDELRQAAQMWEQHDRAVDLLWTGTSYQEFQIWRDRYPGGLTVVEEDFAGAMTALADKRKRRQRLTVSAIVLISLLVAMVTGGMWLRSERAERQAREEAWRAEASKLLALGQLRQEEDPTEALAYTTASLELADTEEARVFALRLLWEGPPAMELDPGGSQHGNLAFSSGGERLAIAGFTDEVRVWTADGEDGRPPVILKGHAFGPIGSNQAAWSSDDLLVTGHFTQDRARVWSFPGGHLVREIEFGGIASWQVSGSYLYAEIKENDANSGHEMYRLRSWRLPNGAPEERGRIDATELGSSWSFFDFNGRGWIYGKGNSVFIRPLPVEEGGSDRLVAIHENTVLHTGTPTDPAHYWTRDTATGELRRWDLSSDEPLFDDVVLSLKEFPEGRLPDPSGRWIVDRFRSTNNRQARVWARSAWPEARPLGLRRRGSWYAAFFRFHPRGDWLVISTHSMSRHTFWPLREIWPSVVDGHFGLLRPIEFSPDGRWLITAWGGGQQLRLWPLPGTEARESRILSLSDADSWTRFAFDPQGRFVVAVGYGAYVVPLDGSPPQRLEGLSDTTTHFGAAVSPSGRLVAVPFSFGEGEKALRIWNLETQTVRVFALPESSYTAQTGHAQGVWDLSFADESTLFTAGDGGVRKWNLETGANELVSPSESGNAVAMALGAERRSALVQETGMGVPNCGPPAILDLATGVVRPLDEFVGSSLAQYPAIALDNSGSVAVVGDGGGVIRVGRLSGGEPHLLVGHEGAIEYVDISPDGRWIASTGDDNTLRLWPMPDLDKPPLHTLPRDELIAKLKSLTNIRVVRDDGSAQGWIVTLDPFPGWKEVPTWR